MLFEEFLTSNFKVIFVAIQTAILGIKKKKRRVLKQKKLKSLDFTGFLAFFVNFKQ